MLDEHDRVIGSVPPLANPAIAAFNRLEQLRAQKSQLQQRRPLILADEDLENTISAVERAVEHVQSELARMSREGKS